MKASLNIEGSIADLQALAASPEASALPVPATPAPAPGLMARIEDASLHTTGRVRLKGLVQPVDLEVTVTLKP